MRKLAVVLLATIVAVFGIGSAQAITVLPDFTAATFVPGAAIDNPYFPINDSLTRIFEGQKEESGSIITERFEFTNLGAGPAILGVQTTMRRDRAYVDDILMEDTFDYFAQDSAGNVWYFGEDVTNYIYDDMGSLTGTNNDSSWRAGVNSALPGFIMPADLNVGFNYYQEFAAADGALDQGTTNAVGQKVKIDIGKFKNVLKVLETTELDANFREFKYYAPGQGLIYVEEGLNSDLMEPELTLELVSIDDEDEMDDDGDGDGDDDMHDRDEQHGRNCERLKREKTNHADDESDEDEVIDDDGEMETADEEEMEDVNDGDEETPSATLARRFSQSLRSLRDLAATRESSLNPQDTIVRLLEGGDAGSSGAALEDTAGSLLAVASPLERSEPESAAAMLLAVGQSASGAELAISAVPEPASATLALAVAGLLLLRRRRLRSVSRVRLRDRRHSATAAGSTVAGLLRHHFSLECDCLHAVTYRHDVC